MFYSARLFLVMVFAVCTSLLAGCENGSTAKLSSEESTKNTLDAAVSPEKAGQEAQEEREVILIPVDRAGYDAAIAAHRGKVVLVDYWATWCLPCMKQFPHTMALAKEHVDDGLVVIKVSLDALEDKPKVINFLRRQGSFSDNLIAKLSTSEAFTQFEIEGSVPFYRLYDREGKPRHTFNGHDEELHERVKELLGR